MNPIGKSGKNWRKVTPEEVTEWRRLVTEERLTLREIARRYGRDHGTIAYNIQERPTNPIINRKPPRKRRPEGWRTLNKILYSAAGMAQRRAKRKGIPFAIDVPFLTRMFEAQDGKCAVTGIPMVLTRSSEFRCEPYAPSIDRIDSKGGYTPDNVRLTVWIANWAMGEWGEEHFARLARAYVDRH
jgi:hypothetical protein